LAAEEAEEAEEAEVSLADARKLAADLEIEAIMALPPGAPLKKDQRVWDPFLQVERDGLGRVFDPVNNAPTHPRVPGPLHKAAARAAGFGRRALAAQHRNR